MAVLSPSPVSSDRFTFVRSGAPFTDGGPKLVAEMSDFGSGFNLGRVYDDACDVGLTVVSRRTGRRVVYAVQHEEYDREGDLLWIDLAPVDRRDRGLPGVRLFND